MKHVTLLSPFLLAAVALGQEPEPKKAIPIPSESHLLEFERIILMHAPEDIRPMDFEIGKEKRRRRRGGADAVDVAITFQRARQPLPVSRKFVDAMVRSAETMPGSAWRLAQLTMVPADNKPDAKWTITKLVFTRDEGGPPPKTRSAPAHEALAQLTKTFDVAAQKGIAHRLTKVEFRDGRGKEASILRADFEVRGLRFRSGYVRIVKMFTDVARDPAGPFEGLLDARGEKLLDDPKAAGASYEICLSLRERSVETRE